MATDVARALGDLEGTVRELSKQWERQEATAVAGRKAVYERVDSLNAKVSDLQAAADGVQRNLAEIKSDIEEKIMPVINAYALGQARWGGVKDAGRFVWAAIIAGFATLGWIIHEILQYLGKVGTLPRLPL